MKIQRSKKKKNTLMPVHKKHMQLEDKTNS